MLPASMTHEFGGAGAGGALTGPEIIWTTVL